MQELVHHSGELFQNPRQGGFVFSAPVADGLAVFLIDNTDVSVYPGIVLIHLLVGGNKELAGFHGVDGDADISQVLAFGVHGVPQIFTEVQDLLLGIILNVAVVAEAANHVLVIGLANTDGLRLQRFAEAEAPADLLHQRIQITADVVQGIFVKYAISCDFHHEAALGIHAGGNVGQLVIGHNGARPDIRAQNACIIVGFHQRRHESLRIIPAGVKKFRKRHSTPSLLL